MIFGVLEYFFSEAALHQVHEGLIRGCADGRACGCKRDDEFAALIHNAERPNGTIERLVFRFQDAAFVRIEEGAGDFFFGVVGAVAANDNLTVAELPHHAVFVGLAQFFNSLGREKRRFPETLPTEGTAELAGGTGLF